MDILIVTKQTEPNLNKRKVKKVNDMSLFENVVEGVKNFIIDLDDEIDMKFAEPLTKEERDRINSAYDWRCIGLEED